MTRQFSDNRMVWLAVGVAAGLTLAYFWPHEPAYAIGVDRNENFSMLTAQTNVAGGLASAEAVFVLDFLTGRLMGAAMNNQSGKFTQFYQRNIAADFQVQAQGKYVMVAGRADLPRRGGGQPGASVLYIGEHGAGRVNAYAFPHRNINRVVPSPQPLVVVDSFQFRQATGQ